MGRRTEKEQYIWLIENKTKGTFVQRTINNLDMFVSKLNNNEQSDGGREPIVVECEKQNRFEKCGPHLDSKICTKKDGK